MDITDARLTLRVDRAASNGVVSTMLIELRIVDRIVVDREQTILLECDVIGIVLIRTPATVSLEHLLLLISCNVFKQLLVVSLDVVGFITERFCFVLKLSFLNEKKLKLSL